jgi:tRNA-splicing ligase RtcB (3'-phosphate/5'-hydroxy nucleic acid ligase)
MEPLISTLATVSTAIFQPQVLESSALGVPVTLFADARIPVSPTALRQARGMAALPGVTHAIAMPDIHAGTHVPNGFVLATDGTVIPGAVGGDINCGMRLLNTGLTRDEVDIPSLLRKIADRIFLGERRGPLNLPEEDVARILSGGVAALSGLSEKTTRDHAVWDFLKHDRYLERERERIEASGSLPGGVERVAHSHIKIGRSQLGTLGDGNHFLEFQVVDEILNEGLAEALGLRRGTLFLMIHSGSRGLGYNVGMQYTQIAQSLAGSARTPMAGIYAIDAEGPAGQNYLSAMNAAANYAFVNRLMLAALATYTIYEQYGDAADVRPVYDVAHNIVKKEIHGGREVYVHRKGATRAFPASRMEGTPFTAIGQPVLIPGSMGTASYILVGHEGSEASLHSVNHGAGRVLSRTEALTAPEERRRKQRGRRLDEDSVNHERRTQAISDKEFRRAMRGIELIYANRERIKGEAPQVYKDIDDVMGVVFDAGLAAGVARVRPVGVIKE